jgi:adenosine deaminase
MSVVERQVEMLFHGYIADNYAAVAQTLSLTEQDLRQLAENSFRSSFLPEKAKEGYIHEVRTWSAEDR